MNILIKRINEQKFYIKMEHTVLKYVPYNSLNLNALQESINLGAQMKPSDVSIDTSQLQTNIDYGALMNQGEIYCITNKLTGEKYIGKTKCMKKVGDKYVYKGHEHRFRQHMTRAFSDNEDTANDCWKFYAGIRYHGWDAFTVHMIERCDLSIINQKERAYIKQFNSRRKGYNSAKGGVPRKFLRRKKRS